MKWSRWVVLLAFALGATAGAVAVEGSLSLHPKTRANLEAAMKGEAFAAAKYQMFADRARRSGHPEIAKLFEDAAKQEHDEHLAEEAKLAGLPGNDADNLRNAIAGEDYEATTMYRQFAEQARAAGDKAAADRFEEIRRDEAKHRDAFRKALEGLQKGVGGAGQQGQR